MGSGRAVQRTGEPIDPTSAVALAIADLEPAVYSVWLVDRLAGYLGGARRWGSDAHARWIATMTIGVLPPIVEGVQLALGKGSSYPVTAWLAVYAAFAMYLMVVSRMILTQLGAVARSIDTLLDRQDSRERVAAWIRQRWLSSRWLQLAFCTIVASMGTGGMGNADHDYPSLHITVAWYFSTWLTVFLATDAVSWVLRLILLTARLRREENLAVSTFAPTQTPAIRELRDFAATAAGVTGVGMFFFATPLVWAVAYLLPSYHNAIRLRTESSVPFAISLAIAIAAVLAPQYFIATIVKRERNLRLKELDLLIPKGSIAHLLDPEVEKRIALFNSLAATGTFSVSFSAFTKQAAGLLAPLPPLLFPLLVTAVDLQPGKDTTAKAHAACVRCAALPAAPRGHARATPGEAVFAVSLVSMEPYKGSGSRAVKVSIRLDDDLPGRLGQRGSRRRFVS